MEEDEPSSVPTLDTAVGENEWDCYHAKTVNAEIKELSW